MSKDKIFALDCIVQTSPEQIDEAKKYGTKLCEVPFEAYKWKGGIYITKWPALEDDKSRPEVEENKDQ